METLIKKYFSNPDKCIRLKKGAFLFHQGEDNNRLYLIKRGSLKGFDPQDQGVYFKAYVDDIIGLNSFFSYISKTLMSVMAIEDSELLYIDRNDTDAQNTAQFTADFMPAVAHMLNKRHVQSHQNSLERQKQLQEIKEVERLASLGQLSAGVAHELNNAITVISRQSEHIINEALQYIKCNELEAKLLNAGLTQGRVISSGQARDMAKRLKKNSSFSDAKLRDYARTGMGEELAQQKLDVAQRAFGLWNLGASLYDVQLAVKQSEHVINSMKSLSSTHVIRKINCDINQSIKNALALLNNSLKYVELTTELDANLPHIYGETGELVQVWTNIIQNAVDAMKETGSDENHLLVKSEALAKHIVVTIRDSGPGIPEKMINEIFKPHVTTKIQGQTFGLGLGLTIVQKIVNSYSGHIDVTSSDEGTTFAVKIPIGETQ